MAAPSLLILSIDGKKIESPVSVSLGKQLRIDVGVDEALGTTIESIPPLPSTLSLSLTALSGVLTAPLSETFTLVARNVKGEVKATLQIQTDPCNPYTFRLIKGTAYLLIKLDEQTLLNGIKSEGFVLTTCVEQGTLSSSIKCNSVLGCWVALETDVLRQPPRFFHYREEGTMQWELPFEEFDVEPINTEGSTVVGWPFSTILWSVTGFVRSVELVGLPKWMKYDWLENSIHGIAEEVGFFEGSVRVSSLNDSISFPVSLEVFDFLSLPPNITVLTLKETNDYHSPMVTMFSVNDTSIERSLFSIPTYFTHSFSQVFILPEGLLTFPFSQ